MSKINFSFNNLFKSIYQSALGAFPFVIYFQYISNKDIELNNKKKILNNRFKNIK